MNSNNSLNTISAHLSRLPLEIYEMIYNEVFLSKPVVRRIRRRADGSCGKHRIPHLMHVSRDTRIKFATSYYSNSVFIFPEPYDLFAWLESVPQEYRKLLKDIRYIVSDLDVRNGRAAWVRSFWVQGLQLRVGKDVAEGLRFQTTAEVSTYDACDAK
ncbi:unnamed protein product [Cercospora beticola]|nr:unnamed protein product [Cercospora beticola]